MFSSSKFFASSFFISSDIGGDLLGGATKTLFYAGAVVGFPVSYPMFKFKQWLADDYSLGYWDSVEIGSDDLAGYVQGMKGNVNIAEQNYSISTSGKVIYPSVLIGAAVIVAFCLLKRK